MGKLKLQPAPRGLTRKGNDQPVPDSRAGESLSHRLWNIRWETYFPHVLTEGISAHAATYAEIGAFMGKHAAVIYRETAFPTVERHSAKERFCVSNADCFVFKEGTTPVGVF